MHVYHESRFCLMRWATPHAPPCVTRAPVTCLVGCRRCTTLPPTPHPAPHAPFPVPMQRRAYRSTAGRARALTVGTRCQPPPRRVADDDTLLTDLF